MGMDVMDGIGSLVGGLGSLYGNLQSYNNAGNANSQVSGMLAQQQMLAAQQAQATAAQRAAAQSAYDQSSADVTNQNNQLQGTIDTMTSNLNGLSDPNSPYMQMARQAMERKDAAAGRNSQWGDREVQLAAMLADYVGKYSPGINNSITAARNQIASNNAGLANIFSSMNNTANTGGNNLLSGLGSAATAANTTGRAAANQQTNALSSLLGSGSSLIKTLSGLFNNSGSSDGSGGMVSSLLTNPSLYGYGSGFGDGSLYGNSFMPLSNYGTAGNGYGALPQGDYFGTGGLFGTPSLGNTGLFDSSIWDE